MIQFIWLKRCTFLLLFVATSAVYASEPVSKSFFGNVAIEGHDTAAYHSAQASADHNAIKGKSEHVVEWKGAKWKFLNAESANKFQSNPTHYSPSYNGHCANALSLGEGLIKTDGTHWEILENKLYLFYAARGRNRWLNGDWKKYKSVADEAWLRIIAD